MVVVNNVLLGRYWPRVGPQETLFLPGTLLLSAPHINNITIIEQENTKNKHMQHKNQKQRLSTLVLVSLQKKNTFFTNSFFISLSKNSPSLLNLLVNHNFVVVI
jgi:hypothetical protein